MGALFSCLFGWATGRTPKQENQIPEFAVANSRSTAVDLPKVGVEKRPFSVLEFPAQIGGSLPEGCTVTLLSSPLEIKHWWLYNEWDPKCQFSKSIQHLIPVRPTLPSDEKEPNPATRELIHSAFWKVRGQYALWKEEKEQASWHRATGIISPEWFRTHVEILYPSTTRFDVCELNGIVLWIDPAHPSRFRLIEGNHRVCAWLAMTAPPPVSCILYFGRSTEVDRQFATANSGRSTEVDPQFVAANCATKKQA